ncbi:MAG: hypothetical protein USCAAHI_00577 [Beijerinckiaceae bacterium]|nr:MAG: hypothetical protein USCAAHI_00577 [Beijerinckiaceae bacterium]
MGSFWGGVNPRAKRMHIKVRISIPPAMWTPWNANLRRAGVGRRCETETS